MNIVFDLLQSWLHLLLGNKAGVEALLKPVNDLLFSLLGHCISNGLAGIGSCADLNTTIEYLLVDLLVFVFNTLYCDLRTNYTSLEIWMKNWTWACGENCFKIYSLRPSGLSIKDLPRGIQMSDCSNQPPTSWPSLANMIVCSGSGAQKLRPAYYIRCYTLHSGLSRWSAMLLVIRRFLRHFSHASPP